MSVVVALAVAGICPTTRAQPAPPAAVRDPVTPASPPHRIYAPLYAPQDRNELQPLVADDPGELRPASGEGPTATPAGFCRANPPWTGRHVLGGVTVSELTLNRGLHLALHDQRKIKSSIRQQTYFGDPDGVTAAILERIKNAWQDHGYLKAQVHGDTKILADNPLDSRIALVLHVDEGPQYRLRQITFEGHQTILNVQALRKLFPLQDGELFNRSAIGQGLDNLRKAYRSFGFINFTSIPNSEVDEASRTVSLAIDMDEGRQFHVSGIRIVGLDDGASENFLKDLVLKPGEVYDERLADLFLLTDGSWLPSAASPESRIHMALDEPAGTVALSFDFGPCPVE